MKILTYLLLGLTIFVFTGSILHVIMRRRILISQRLDDLQFIENNTQAEIDITKYTEKASDESILFSLPVLGNYLRKTADQMRQAHLYLKPAEYLIISVILSLLIFLIFLTITKNLGLALITAILTFAAPKIYIVSLQEKRRKLLNNQLPEFLNILSNALRAGLSFNQAIVTAGNEMTDPIRWEFQKVMRDNNLGRPIDVALEELAKRTGDEDIEMLVSAIIIQRQVGGNLSEILDMIANTIRERVRLRGEIRTMTAQNKMAAVVIGLLPIAMGFVLTILNPTYMDPLFSDPVGQVLIIIAIFMVIMGAIMLKRITKLEV